MSDTNRKRPAGAHVYNIKAVVTQTGLKADTIRAWERRYGFPRPQRTQGRHRLYTKRDIETLKWLTARRKEGMSISHAIDLRHSYIEKGADPIRSLGEWPAEPPGQLVHGVEGSQVNQLRQDWVAACLSFDRERAGKTLEHAFALFDPETVCIELLQKGLAEVGNGWYDRKVTVQQEHFMSALSVQRLQMLIAATTPPTRPERIIMSTAPGDHHVFSPLLLTYLLRRRGQDVIYLGADVPADELDVTIAQVQPKLVIISAQLLHTAAALKDIALNLRSQDVPLAYGGQVFNRMPLLQKLIPGHFLGETLEEAVNRANELINLPLPDAGWIDLPENYERALAKYHESRSLIDSHVWSTFAASNKPTEHLTAINNDIAQTIEAVLKLGDTGLLQNDITWLEHLLMGYDLPRALVIDYVVAYNQAVELHLGDSAGDIVDWLSNMARSQEVLHEA
jgi:DNA-binding transcriptional MerR regulator/methylmalonyl-CoA mutase cobalamin-binding subunit